MQKDPKVLKVEPRYRIRFLHPTEDIKPSEPVATKLVRNIGYFPEWAEGFVFQTSLEMEIELPNGRTKTIETEPLCSTGIFMIVRGDGRAKTPAGFFSVPVGNNYINRLNVFVSNQQVADEQKAAA